MEYEHNERLGPPHETSQYLHKDNFRKKFFELYRYVFCDVSSIELNHRCFLSFDNELARRDAAEQFKETVSNETTVVLQEFARQLVSLVQRTNQKASCLPQDLFGYISDLAGTLISRNSLARPFAPIIRLLDFCEASPHIAGTLTSLMTIHMFRGLAYERESSGFDDAWYRAEADYLRAVTVSQKMENNINAHVSPLLSLATLYRDQAQCLEQIGLTGANRANHEELVKKQKAICSSLEGVILMGRVDVQLQEQLIRSAKMFSKALYEVGAYKALMHDDKDALNYYDEALKTAGAGGYVSLEAVTLFQLAIVYERLKDFRSAAGKAYLAIRKFEEAGDMVNSDIALQRYLHARALWEQERG